MNLTIDVGNSRTKFGFFQDDELRQVALAEKLTVPALKSFAYNQTIEKIILSAVSQLPDEVAAYLSANFPVLQLTSETPLPIGIRYKTPKTLGNDRVAAAVGAFHLYPGETCLVVDAGTCITMDVLSASGKFLGGNISPGIEMRLRAMHHFTAKLPLVAMGPELPPALGDSTENAIRNGAELGALLELEGFIRRCKQKFRPLRVVFTGGDTDFFVGNTKTKIFAHQNLVLIGLNQILKHNAKIFEGV